ncbi:uncharacterized protein [Lepeophtheirus salmonis]|uniref:uncharacterized protein n=1 Tax=Lepeophtheirus salmonis TaxID=72036 RepID=UPI001AE48EE3|nr:uncharacterized protein LOC121122667 [Lepeophtheirus salmonis]
MIMKDTTNNNKQIRNESFTYDLFIDFEAELEALLRPQSRDDSKNESFKSRDIRYNIDGTIFCEDLNHASLCAISQSEELSQLKSFSVSVATRNIGDNLSIFSYLFRSLTSLTLDFSKIISLRVIGDEIPTLRTLSVNCCNLDDLDGISYINNITTLFATDNNISDVLPLTDLRKINSVDLEKNSIRNYNAVSFLCLCPKLEHLILKGNQISSDSNYRQRVFGYIPHLSTLDVCPQNRKRSCRSYSFDDKRNNDDDQNDTKNSNVSNDLNDALIQKLINQKSEEEVPETLVIPEQAETTPIILDKEVEGNKDIIISTTTKEEALIEVNSQKEHIIDSQGFRSQKDEITSLSHPVKELLSSHDSSNEQLSLNYKLLYRRKSIDPVKLRLHDESEEETSLKSNDRPDSSSSYCSSTIQSTDSGISESLASQREYSNYSSKLPQLHQSSEDPHPQERDVHDKKHSTNNISEKTTKILYNTSSMSKLLRQDSQLNGKLIKDGDIEIEDFEEYE